MGNHYTQLCLEERRNLWQWRDAGFSVAEIADRLGRNPSTLHRELKRNRVEDREVPAASGYHPLTAQSLAEDRRARHRKLIQYPQTKAYVLRQLKSGWSPEQIAGRMRREGRTDCISHETIYRFAYSRDGRVEEIYRHLPECRRRRRPRNQRRHHGKRFPQDRSILFRPDRVAARTEFGHWECDLMMFRKSFGKANMTTATERVTRYTMLRKNPDRTSKPVMQRVGSFLGQLPAHARRSITFDRGTEFSAWHALESQTGATSWFCDPQSPWQKGTVENTNRRLRRYLPRTLDPALLTGRDILNICERMNATPRKCLNYETPAEAFKRHLLASGNHTG